MEEFGGKNTSQKTGVSRLSSVGIQMDTGLESRKKNSEIN